MNANRTWFKSSKAKLSLSLSLSSSRRKLSPLVEVFEERMLMTAGCGTGTTGAGFLAGSVLMNGGSGTGVANVTIDLYKPGSCTPIAVQTTDCNGQYMFTGLNPGSYTLKEVLPRGYTAVGTDINSELNPATSVDSKTINVTVVDPTNVTVNYGGIVNGSYGVVNDVVQGGAKVNSVGPMADTLGTSAGDTSLNSGFQTFCVNDLQNLSFGGGESYKVTPRPITQLNDGSSTISTDHAGRIAYLFNHYGGNALNNVQGAALQVAIWELLYDKGSTPDFTQGAFQLTGPDTAFTDQATFNQIVAQAQSYYAESCGHSETAVFLDAASANPGQINGLQSVLCTDSLDFTITKSTPTPCTPPNNGFHPGGGDSDENTWSSSGTGHDFGHDVTTTFDQGNSVWGSDRDTSTPVTPSKGGGCASGITKFNGWGTSSSTGGWSSESHGSRSCNVGFGAGWSLGNSFSWCSL